MASECSFPRHYSNGSIDAGIANMVQRNQWDLEKRILPLRPTWIRKLRPQVTHRSGVAMMQRHRRPVANDATYLSQVLFMLADANPLLLISTQNMVA